MPAVPKPKHKRRVPTRRERGKFSQEVRQQIYDRDNGICQHCLIKPGQEIHHVKLKSSGKGRGVFHNGLLLCSTCHRKIHDDKKLIQRWQDVFTERYGPKYYEDEYDK